MYPAVGKDLNLSPAVVEIHLESITGDIGAYHLQVHYDPSILAIDRIISVSGSAPITDRKTFSYGRAGIIGMQPGGGLSNRVPIVVFFKPVSEGKSRVSVSIKSLYNPESKPITGTIRLSADELTVTR
jgi:hypothetical protein